MMLNERNNNRWIILTAAVSYYVKAINRDCNFMIKVNADDDKTPGGPVDLRRLEIPYNAESPYRLSVISPRI